MKAIKTPSLFIIFFISLAICACENPMIAKILQQPKTITFDSNGGSYVPPQTVLRNEKISKPNDPFRAGYSFGGWFTDNYSFDNKWDFNNIPESNMTLYADWGTKETQPPTDSTPPIQPPADSTPPTNSIIPIDQLEDYLRNSLEGGSPSNPIKVKLNVTNSEMLNLASILKNSDKYVSLDLSDSDIKSIPDYAFSFIEETGTYLYKLTSVTIPDSVTSIGVGAFYKCDNLTSVNIPSGVISIGGSAFAACTSLTSVNIPSGVTSIEGYAFNGCHSLKSVTIPNGVTSIGEGAFYYCTSFTSITIPNSVTSIVYRAFVGCTSLTSVTFATGSNIINFGNDAFPPEGSVSGSEGSDNLKNVYLAADPKAGTYKMASDGTWTKQ